MVKQFISFCNFTVEMLKISIRTTLIVLLTTFASEEEAEKVAKRLAEWTENYGASSWNNRYRDSFVLMGQVKAQHIKS